MLELQKRINDAIFNFEIIRPNLEDNLFKLISLFGQINLEELQWEPPTIQLYGIDRGKYITFHLPNESYFKAMVSFYADTNYEMVLLKDPDLIKINAFPQTNSLSFITKIVDSSTTNHRVIEIFLYKTLYISSSGGSKTEIDIISITVPRSVSVSALSNISTYPTFMINEYTNYANTTNLKIWSYLQLRDMIAYIVEKLLRRYSFKFVFYADIITKSITILLNELSGHLKKNK